MQEIHKRIYEMAVAEVPQNYFNLGDELSVIYKGFKISKKAGEYIWKDVRYSNLYDPVDPIITEKILEIGFDKALTLVRVFNDQERVLELTRKIERLDNEVEYWVNQSTKIYNFFKKELSKVNKLALDAAEKKKRRDSSIKKYNKKKRLYEKKRRILKEEKEEVKADQFFYNSRIKSFNN